MIRNERLHVPEEGYKRGGKVKGKKAKAKAKAKRKVTGKAKRGKKTTLPPLTTGSMGLGQGSYQAVVAPSGGAFQAPSYFRAVGSSEQYASVPPVLREFVKQQEKMWEDLKKGRATVDGTPMEDVAKATPVLAPMRGREQQREEKDEAEDIVGGGGLPYAFAPASGEVMKPTDAMIDAPSSSYAPLLASPPDDLSQSASASSAVASSASSASQEEEEAGVAPPSEEQEDEEIAHTLAKRLAKQGITSPHKLDFSQLYDKGRVEVMAQDLGIKLPDMDGGKRVRRWKDVPKRHIADMIFARIGTYLPTPSSSSSSSSSSSGAW